MPDKSGKPKKIGKREAAALKRLVDHGRVTASQKGLPVANEITAAMAQKLTDRGYAKPAIADWWHAYEPTDAGRAACQNI